MPDLFDDKGDTTIPVATAPELDSEEEKRYVSINLHLDGYLLSNATRPAKHQTFICFYPTYYTCM